MILNFAGTERCETSMEESIAVPHGADFFVFLCLCGVVVCR